MPAASKPSTFCLGPEKPSANRIIRPMPRGTRNPRTRASPELTVVAVILTRISSSPGTGVGTSRICTTSGGP